MPKVWNAKGWIKKVLAGGVFVTIILPALGWIISGAWTATANFVDRANATAVKLDTNQAVIEQKFQTEDQKIAALKDTQDRTYQMVWQIYLWQREDHK